MSDILQRIVAVKRDEISVARRRRDMAALRRDAETLGGAGLHAEVSGLGDYFAEDEMDALRMCREVISHLNWRKQRPTPPLVPERPPYDPAALLALVSRARRQPAAVRGVTARSTAARRLAGVRARAPGRGFPPLSVPTHCRFFLSLGSLA